MEPCFQLRPAESADHCQTTLDQQAGLRHVTTTWRKGESSATFSDYFLEGLQLTTLTGHLPQPLRVALYAPEPWTAMLFPLDGQLHATPGARYPLSSGSDPQIRTVEEAPAHLYTLQGLQHRSFAVHLTRERFANLVAANEEWASVHRLQLREPEPVVLLPPHAAISPALRTLIEQLINCPYHGALKKLFLEARFLDLFIEQQTQLVQLRTRARSRDRDIMYAVRDFLDTHYAEPPSLLEIARQFGTNDFKLKKGFRELFGTTVFAYIAERRLTVAHQLLTLTDQPVQEVAETVGFTNAAHFATVFRHRFGRRPTQLRRMPQHELVECGK
ncbi:helix-turn-helix transcriptional regulator [Hymenobacter volaticus]|uniref:AraC family transcriptional regulator n=1 Tax=Hymenobacter volaticus TaxID=2932254 RepID=A0ABY4GDK2_9BACT|nr:AraC family transcriptional regulator [Hymenobacter volaticus]UOQ69000.1 AraC family transcriptional regulator [Hymenobacter volaticus]